MPLGRRNGRSLWQRFQRRIFTANAVSIICKNAFQRTLCRITAPACSKNHSERKTVLRRFAYLAIWFLHLNVNGRNCVLACLTAWLRPMVPQRCVVHSFRHSLRDRLRAVQCPSDIIDQLGGWKTAGVGQGYGEGYPLEVLAEWVSRIQLQF